MSTEQLEDFFNYIEKTFEDILKSEDWFLEKDIKVLANKAWNNDLKFKFDSLQKDVIGSKGERLARAGLSGDQLEFKMLMWLH